MNSGHFLWHMIGPKDRPEKGLCEVAAKADRRELLIPSFHSKTWNLENHIWLLVQGPMTRFVWRSCFNSVAMCWAWLAMVLLIFGIDLGKLFFFPGFRNGLLHRKVEAWHWMLFALFKIGQFLPYFGFPCWGNPHLVFLLPLMPKSHVFRFTWKLVHIRKTEGKERPQVKHTAFDWSWMLSHFWSS